MRKASNRIVVALLGLVFVLAGCAEVGITGRKQLNFVPDSIINSLSIQQYSQFIKESKLSTDATKTAMVKRVGENIRNAVDRYCKQYADKDPFAGYQWEFNLVEDPNVNAFAMPGGKVVVYTGILPVTQNDAGLATVLGHEIAHVFAKHGSERMSQALIVQMGGVGLSAALKNQPEATRNLFTNAYGLGTQVGILLPYSRLHESEADRLGLIFMAMAGYDPHEAVSFWQRMAAAKGDAPRPPNSSARTRPTRRESRTSRICSRRRWSTTNRRRNSRSQAKTEKRLHGTSYMTNGRLPALSSRAACQGAGGPAHLEIVAAAGAVHVDHFTGEEESRAELRLHRSRIDLVRADAAAGDRGLGNRLGAYYGQGQSLDHSGTSCLRFSLGSWPACTLRPHPARRHKRLRKLPRGRNSDRTFATVFFAWACNPSCNCRSDCSLVRRQAAGIDFRAMPRRLRTAHRPGVG